ncbi:MAG: multiheme c-type cytochrome [Wenzhouxiangellaceae bacterium]
MSSRHAEAVALVFVWLAGSGLQAQPLPSEAEYKHLGAATCATSVCHGKVTPDENSNVLLNEYRTWSSDDYHSDAYNVLRSDESRRMVEILGLGNATTERICLDCHADNIPAARRGEKFQISDGVSCEACHGGAERWIESHAEEGATHQDNLALGMYPTDKPEARARLCLSCHVGTEQRFAGHDIMAAGHPRMSFELETFSVNQPAHYRIDEDYVERKGDIGSVNMWVTGMLLKAERQLDLLRSDLFSGHGLFPELAFFDCHACHHPMNDRRMHATPVTSGLPPGAVRLDDSSFQMLLAIGSALDSGRTETLRERTRNLHLSTTRGREPLRGAAAELGAALDDLRRLAADRDYSEQEMREIRKLLLERAGDGQYGDFTSAEQAFLAVETLTIELGESQALDSSLDAWFDTLASEHDFNPAGYATAARRVSADVR